MMLIVFSVISHVAVASVFGSMAFFSGVIAPLTFTKLSQEAAGHFVRAIFPWYYLVIAAFSFIACASLLASHGFAAAVMGVIALGAVVARQVVMPRINYHRDQMIDGNPSAEKSFSALHRLSVWINGCQIIGALLVLVLLSLH